MLTNLRKTLRFQIGAIVTLILAILVGAFISMHTVSVKYDREVLADKQEKLKVISQGLSRGLASLIQNGQNTTGIKLYFENQAEGIVNTNPRLVVGLYLPGLGISRFYGEPSRDTHLLLFRRQAEMSQNDEFFDIKLSSIKKARAFVDDRRGGILLGRAEPLVTGGQVKGAVLVAEQVQPGLTMFRYITRLVPLLVTGSLIIGIVATAFILARLKRGVRQITSGLAAMEKDSGYRLAPPVAGELEEISGAINKMADAVEQKALLEEQLEKSSRLAALGQLVAGVAHEIRNPLGIMKATIQVMQDDFAGQEQAGEYLAVLNEQVERQNRIIRELLDYAKPVPPIFQTVNANDIIQSLVGFSRSYFQQHNVAAELELAGDLPPVHGDVEKLKQVFLNLMFNAVEAMPEGGRLTIRTARENDQIVIEFADNGRGIAEEDMNRLFDPFFSTKNTGTGLGLAMVHKIVEMHRGSTEVDSKLEQGTVFRIILPVEHPEE